MTLRVYFFVNGMAETAPTANKRPLSLSSPDSKLSPEQKKPRSIIAMSTSVQDDESGNESAHLMTTPHSGMKGPQVEVISVKSKAPIKDQFQSQTIPSPIQSPKQIPEVPDFNAESIKSMSHDEKLNLIILQLSGLTAHCQGNENKIKSIARKVYCNTQNIDSVKESLEEKVRYLEGRSARLEDKVEKMAKKLEDLEYHSKRENVIIYGIPEPKEAATDDSAKMAALTFFQECMKCSNPNRINIDIAHRVGAITRGKGRARPLVVYFNTRTSKNYVMSHARNLSGTKYSISDQLPKAMQERRTCQLGDYKRLREEKGKDKVKLVRDKLIVEGKLVDPCLEKNPVKPVAAPTDGDEIQWAITKEQTVDKSTFWGFSRAVECIEDVQEGLAHILEDYDNVEATHIVYTLIGSSRIALLAKDMLTMMKLEPTEFS